MKMTEKVKRIFASILVMIMVAGLMPVNTFAAEDSVVVLSASDYQQKGTAPQSNTTAILNQIKQDYTSADGFLFGGDYYQDTLDTTTKSKEGKTELDNAITASYPNLENRVYIQGNHDNDSLVSDGTLSSTGAHDTDHYGVYAINEKDYPWGWQASSAFQSTCQKTADALDVYLDAKADAGYTKPIFVITHVPLHFSPRTSSMGDGKYAKYLYDVLDEAGSKGLNIIFLFGHNHSNTYDDYIGGGQIYLAKGSTIAIANEGSTTYFTDELTFTYMNCGYVGYIGGKAGTNLSISVFEIRADEVIVKRYGTNGLVQLKAAGVTTSGAPTADTSIVESGATISLGAPVPAVTLTDNNVTVTSAGLTGLSVTKLFGTDGKDSYDDETYSAYASYDINPQGYTQGKSATVTIKLDTEDAFDASRPVVVIDRQNGSEKQLNIENGTVTFATNHFSTYDVAQRDPSAGYTYELATSIEAGKSYVIVGNSNAVALMDSNGSLGSQNVTISGNILTSETELTEWTFSSANSGTITSSDGRKLGYSSSSWNLTGSGDCTFDIAAGSGNFSLRVVRSSSGYNRYYFNYDGSGWTSKPTSAAYVRLYQPANNDTTDPSEPSEPIEPSEPVVPDAGGEWIELPAGNTYVLDTDGIDSGAKYLIVAKSYAKALTAAASRSNANDVTLSDEIAVTSGMVSWDKSFDGKSEGTYTGTVSYANEVLGTITVTVIAQHNFETVTVDATCTEDGSVTTKCTICGEQTVEVIKAIGHDYKCMETAATCGKDGAKVYTCANCADTYTEVIDATGEHTFETVTVAATCTQEGSVTTTCTVCGEQTVERIAAFGHKYTSVTKEATCTEAGSVTYTCENCGDSYVETIAALGHCYESTVTSATCTENGYTTYTCTACGHTYVGEEIAAFGHDYASKITATCTEAGFVVYTCNTCGHSYNGETVAAYGHNYETATVEPTCGTAGYTTYVCTACGYTYTGDEVTALGHAYEAVVTAATCTEAGYTTFTCTVCGHSYVGDNVAALGHDYDSVVTAPTYEAEGYTTHTCKVCGYVTVDSFVPMLRHTYETVTTEATCTEDGSVIHTCVDCGYSYTEMLPALGHTTETVTTEATCTADGSVVTTCTDCGETDVEVIPATGHSYETITIAATCTEAGYTTNTCTCGHVVTEETAALGHAYSSKTVAPTCTENGGIIYTCETCGYSYTDGNTAATGHSYTTKEENGKRIYTCKNCGYSYSESLAMTYTKVSSISGDNNYVITFVSGNKYYAMSHKDNKISAVQVKVSSNKITTEITEDLVWTYVGNKLSYQSGNTTYYLYAKPSNSWWGGTPTLSISSSNSTNVSFSNSKLKLSNYYLRYSSGKISLNSKSSTTNIFLEQ